VTVTAWPPPEGESRTTAVSRRGRIIRRVLPDAVKTLIGDSPRITPRKDVNSEILAKEPLLSFISQKVLPLTAYRPGLAVYPQVSQALQQATADIVSGKSVDEAAATYQSAVEKVAGADKVAKS
jgi:multiple sugar transport system substrate-binding protein